MSDIKIPEEEQENVVSMFWQMLVQIEGDTDPEVDRLNYHLVRSGYNLMNRIGVTEERPRWESKSHQPSVDDG